LCIFILILHPVILHSEIFLSLHVEDLVFKKGKPLPRSFREDIHFTERSGKSTTPFTPYLRTSDAQSSFLALVDYTNRPREILSSSLRICLRNPEALVSGSLFIPDGSQIVQEYPFTYNSNKSKKLAAERKSEVSFQTNKLAYYQAFQALELPGAAWFRNQVRQASKRLNHLQPKDNPEPFNSRNTRFIRPSQEAGLENSMDLFSGGRAISENLQLDRELRLSSDEQNRTIPISSISGITISEIPWEKWIKDKKPKLDPLASILPHDQHAVIFPSYSSMLDVMNELNKQGTPLLRLSENRAESARSREKYSQQLCLPVDRLSEIIGPKLIASVAITGSDPFLRTGTSLTIIFQAKQKQTLLAALSLYRVEAQKKSPSAKLFQGKIPGFENSSFIGLSSPDRSIRSYVSSFGNFVVVTNSIEQLIRIAKVVGEKETSLVSLLEYQFFRQRYPLTKKSKEDAFLMITDATIRRWCGPEWRIAASRRTRAASVMAELQARHENGSPIKPTEYQELGEVTFINGSVQSSQFGNLEFLKSVEELKIKMITPAEKMAYAFFRDRYQSHWSKYFDPIAGQLIIDDNEISGDLSVLPLIGGTDYQQMIETVGQVKLKPQSGDPHPEAVLHWISAIDMDSPRFKQASNFASIMAPSLGVGAFSWVGKFFSFYLDESSFFNEVQNMYQKEGFQGGNNFVQKQIGRLPLGFNIEIQNPFKLTAFLAGLRAWLQQTAPGMTIWTTHSHKGQGFVKVSLGKGLEESLMKEGSVPLALYYVPSAKMLTLSLREEIIKRAINRNLLRREQVSLSKKPEWDEMSTAIHLSGPMPSIIDSSMGLEAGKELQKKSWKNLFVLNEWKIKLHQDDPIDYHRKVWKTELICPGRGDYVWNQNYQTFESTVFGHPGNPKMPENLNILGKWKTIDLGINFENDGLRIEASVTRKEEE